MNLDALGARKMLEGLDLEKVHSLDFSEIGTVSFEALRVLLIARNNGLKINVINACDSVASMFEEAGISGRFCVCRAPGSVDISRFTKSGESPMSTTYLSDDGDKVLKLYSRMVTGPDLIEREKRMSMCALQLGIPTPMPGRIVSVGNQRGLIFEYVHNKKSFSRLIADDQEHYEVYAKRFALMTRKLHSTECNTAVFGSISENYSGFVKDCPAYSDTEKKKYLDFIDSIPACTTCIHGDLHPGNLVTSGEDDMWIDMGDFSYGNPWFDLGQFYMISHLTSDEMARENHHFSKDLMLKVWDVFVHEYFGVSDESEIKTIEARSGAMAALGLIKFAFRALPKEHFPVVKQTVEALFSGYGWKF